MIHLQYDLPRCDADIITGTRGERDMCLAPLLEDGTCAHTVLHVDALMHMWRCSECNTYTVDVTARTLPDGSRHDLCVPCAAAIGLARSGARRR